MIAFYYQDIYLLIVFLLTCISLSQYTQQSLLNINSRRNNQSALTFIIVVFIICYIGLRPVHNAFIDMIGYDRFYNSILYDAFEFDWHTDNKLYDNWVAYMASLGIPSRIVFLIYSVVYFGSIFWACKRMFPRDLLLAFVVYLASFSTFSYGTNGMKAGMAAAIFLVALSYRKKLWISIPLALITYGMHHAMALVVASYIVVLLIKNVKFYFYLWLISFVLAALHVSYFQFLFAGFTDEHGAEYLLSSQHSGFRLDFIIYSIVPIVIGYILLYKYKVKSDMYNALLALYMCTNSVWLLCMYSSFTNRISYLSWFLYPIVLLYPFLNIVWSKFQKRYLQYVVYGHVGFTIFMHFVYYRYLH